jgi:hypothetical protein
MDVNTGQVERMNLWGKKLKLIFSETTVDFDSKPS